MRWEVAWVGFLWAVSWGGAWAERASMARDLEDAFVAVAQEVGPTVVTITARGPSPGAAAQEEEGIGSGVIIDKQGYILTNEHVIAETRHLEVILTSGKRYAAKVVGADARADLAVLKVEADGLPAIRVGDSDRLRIGQWAIALGNPFGLAWDAQPSVTVGVISALRRAIRQNRESKYYGDLIQTDAAVNPGNSGGPLVDIDGRLIGINVLIFSTSGGYQGIGFAIPVNRAMRVAQSLQQHGKVVYGWLGVRVEDRSESLASSSGLRGAVIKQVMENTPARQGGLCDKDLVVQFDERPIRSADELTRLVTETPAGKKVQVKVWRDGREQELWVVLGRRTDFESASSVVLTWRGMEVQSLTEPLAKVLGIPSGDGVVITEVVPGTAGARAAIKARAVVRAVLSPDGGTRLPIRTLQDFRTAVEDQEGAVVLLVGDERFLVQPEEK